MILAIDMSTELPRTRTQVLLRFDIKACSWENFYMESRSLFNEATPRLISFNEPAYGANGKQQRH